MKRFYMVTETMNPRNMGYDIFNLINDVNVRDVNNNINYFENLFNIYPSLTNIVSSNNYIDMNRIRSFDNNISLSEATFRQEFLNQLNRISYRVREDINEGYNNVLLTRVVLYIREIVQNQINAIPNLDIVKFIGDLRNNLNIMIDLNISNESLTFSENQIVSIIENSLRESITNSSLNVVRDLNHIRVMNGGPNRIDIDLNKINQIKMMLNQLLWEIRIESNRFIGQINHIIYRRNTNSDDESSSESLLDTSDSSNGNINVVRRNVESLDEEETIDSSTEEENNQISFCDTSTVYDTRENITIPKCSMCMENNSIIVFNCGHLCSCISCSRRVNECPICRKSISRRQRIFLP